MSNWTPQDWAMLLTAVGTLVGAVLSALAAFLANLAKVRSEANGDAADGITKKADAISQKIDTNTRITKEGTEAATQHAEVAAKVAEVAAKTAADAKIATETMTESVSRKLNGGIDAAINMAIQPLREKIDGVNEYVHQRNHDILSALQALTNRIAIIDERLKSSK